MKRPSSETVARIVATSVVVLFLCGIGLLLTRASDHTPTMPRGSATSPSPSVAPQPRVLVGKSELSKAQASKFAAVAHAVRHYVEAGNGAAAYEDVVGQDAALTAGCRWGMIYSEVPSGEVNHEVAQQQLTTDAYAPWSLVATGHSPTVPLVSLEYTGGPSTFVHPKASAVHIRVEPQVAVWTLVMLCEEA